MIDKSIPALNGLRGIAALIVVVSHFSNETGLFGGILGWGAGQTGVMLFFILAGFLMTHLHIHEPFQPNTIGAYALKRFARIYPLFLLVAALPGILSYIKFPAAIPMSDINSLAKYLGQVALVDRGSNVFWTIQIEVLCYVLFVGIWGLHASLKRDAIMLALVVASIVAVMLFKPVSDALFLMVVHYFLAGVASAMALRIFGAGNYRSAVVSLLSVLLLATIPLTFPKVFALVFGGEIQPWSSFLLFSQVVILFNLVLRDKRYLNKILSSKPLVWVGRVSYSIYLLHYFILTFMTSWFVPSNHYAVSFFSFIAVVFAVSAMSYRYIETPLQSYVRRLPSLISSRALGVGNHLKDQSLK